MNLPIVNIFINDNTPDNILSILSTQLFLTNIIPYSQLDGYDGYSERLLVLIDYSNRDNIDTSSADLILYYSNWLIAVQLNTFGPSGLTFAVQNITLDKLLTKYIPKRPCCKKWVQPHASITTIDMFGSDITIPYNRYR